MLSQSLETQFNAQLNALHQDVCLAWQMSAWASAQGYGRCGVFLMNHASSQLAVMRQIFEHMAERGSMAQLAELAAPQQQYDSLEKLFSLLCDTHGAAIERLDELTHAAFSQQDYSAFNGLKDLLSQQNEIRARLLQLADAIQLLSAAGKQNQLDETVFSALATSLPLSN